MSTFVRFSIVSILAIAAFAFMAPREAEARGFYGYGRPYRHFGAYYRPVPKRYYRPYPRHHYRARYAPVYPRVHYRPYGYGRAFGYGRYWH
jgi:hypothetical protein